MTLATYGRLRKDRLDEVADAMDAARTLERARRGADSVANALLPFANW